MIVKLHPSGGYSYGIRFERKQTELIPNMKVNLIIRYSSGNYIFVPGLEVNSCYEIIDVEIRRWVKHLGHINYAYSNPPFFNLTKVGTTNNWILEEI